MLYQVDPGPAYLARVTFGIRGITIGLSTVRLAAEDFGRRGSSSKFAMRETLCVPKTSSGLNL